LLPGNGTSRARSAALSASLPLSHLVQDVKYLEMTVCLFKVNAYIISICIAFLNGQNKAHLKTVLYAAKNGSKKIDNLYSLSH